MNIIKPPNTPEYTPSTLIISYKPAIGKEPLLKAIKKYNAQLISDLEYLNMITIKIPEGCKIEDAIKYFKNIEGVLQVSRDRILHLV